MLCSRPVEEAAVVAGVSATTIFRWFREGLERIKLFEGMISDFEASVPGNSVFCFCKSCPEKLFSDRERPRLILDLMAPVT